MPKKPAKAAPKMRPDANETAYRVMLEATGQAPKTDPAKKPKNPDAVKRGKKGGKTRAKNLTGKELGKIGKKGADERWKDR